MRKKIPPLTFFLLFSGVAGFCISFLLIHPFLYSQSLFFIIPLFFLLFLSIYLRHRKSIDKLNLQKEELEEKRNLDAIELSRLSSLRDSLKKKIRDYQYLESFTGRLNKETLLDDICDAVVNETFSLFGSRGNVLLYLIGGKNRRLQLRAIKKENEFQKVKEKMGDLFDEWCLRHRRSLLVESAMSDFRFNPDRIREEVSRPVGSLICVPLVAGARTLGILRVDSPIPESYHSEDLRFLSVVGDIAELSIENAVFFKDMQELSITDGLTGVFLRRFAMQRLDEEFLRAQRENSPLSFLMLDIDYFKGFNDEFGHMAGDVVLKKVAKSLGEFFNLPGSLVFRYGGEEFGVVLAHSQKKEVLKLAEGFRKTLRTRELVLRRRKVRVTVSIGVAVFPDDVSTGEDLIRGADEALFAAKRAGRDRVCHL